MTLHTASGEILCYINFFEGIKSCILQDALCQIHESKLGRRIPYPNTIYPFLHFVSLAPCFPRIAITWQTVIRDVLSTQLRLTATGQVSTVLVVDGTFYMLCCRSFCGLLRKVCDGTRQDLHKNLVLAAELRQCTFRHFIRIINCFSERLGENYVSLLRL